MKKLYSLLCVILLIAILSSCSDPSLSESTPTGSINTLPTGTATATPSGPTGTTQTNLSTKSEKNDTTTATSNIETPTPKYFELPYTTKNLYMPISELYEVEDLQCRSGDGTGRYFAVIARVFNEGETPIVVTSGTLSVDYGDSKSTGIKNFTSFYVMPYQTGFVVLRASFSADEKFDPEKVDYSYSIRTAEPKLKTARYFAESATATVMHYGSEIGAISFDIMMKDPPGSRLVQADVVLWDKDGVAVDAFSQKITHRDGRIQISYTPDKNISTDDIASYSFSLSTQCNE